ncbi:hypothetical protein ACT3TS_11065 [Specibacter sp. AOP5-B1-6]|uniref:hypothetical protein n=1 Tax=Specibacter sp. AOP5-B1-6 TaxID=3457653 RepID=UPI003FB8FC24
MMTSGDKFVHKMMHATEKFQKVFGPADQGDMDSPVVHRHDEYEDNSDEQLSHFAEETDSEGHHYAVRKDEQPAEEH